MQGLASRLEEVRAREFHAVCLPDFFLDHFVALPPFVEAVSAMKAVHDRGGGNLPGSRQQFAPGGNAANAAHALAHLGVTAHLVCRTSPFGLAFLRETLGRAGVDLQRVRTDGQLAVTAALEFGPEHRNVMLNDPGSVARYGPEDLDENARTLLRASDAVLVSNWTLNVEGTELAREAFRVAREGRALTYFDTGDPTPAAARIPAMLEGVAQSPDLDVFAMNENEMRQFGGEGDPLEAGARLAKTLSATVDLHTASFAATWGPRGHARAPSFRVAPRRATGAGDAWNAGNLLGHLLELAPGERLTLANAVAGLYLESPVGEPPSLDEVRAFFRATSA